MSSRYLYLIGFFLTGLAALYLFKGGTPETAPTAVVAEAPMKERRFQDPEALKMIPWRELALSQTDDGYWLTIVPRTIETGCQRGDLDAIRGDLATSESRSVILTIESLGSTANEPAPLVQEISTRQFAAKPVTRYRLELPKGTGPRQLGLFICKDSGGTKRCGDKKLENIDAILADQKANEKNADFAAPDRIYFFQYLFVDERGHLFSFENSPVARQTFEALDEKLATLFTEASRVETERKHLARARELSDRLRSYPLHHDKDTLHLILPGGYEKPCRIATGPNGFELLRPE